MNFEYEFENHSSSKYKQHFSKPKHIASPGLNQEPLNFAGADVIDKPHKSAEVKGEEYQDLKSTMVDSAFFDGKSGMQAYSNMFASHIGSEEPQVIEVGPSESQLNESMTAQQQSFTDKAESFAASQDKKAEEPNFNAAFIYPKTFQAFMSRDQNAKIEFTVAPK